MAGKVGKIGIHGHSVLGRGFSLLAPKTKKELGMSAAELARQLDVPPNRITEILNGRRAITGDTALRLAHFFGTSAEFWLNLQSLYEIRLAEQKSGKSIKALPTLKRTEHSAA